MGGKHPGPWSHVLEQFDSRGEMDFTVLYVEWPAIIWAFGVMTPWGLEESTPRFFRTKQFAIRMWSSYHLGFWEGVMGEGFTVAPVCWLPEMREAFGLKDAPTPYEVACALTMRSVLWNPGKGRGEFEDERAALAWWLVGLPVEVLSDILGEDWEEKAARAIRWWMTQPRFGLWALGRNIAPAIQSRNEAAALAGLYLGKLVPSRTRRQEPFLHKMWDHPFVQYLRQDPERAPTAPRPLYIPGIVWPSLESRKDWLENGPYNKRHKTLKRIGPVSYLESKRHQEEWNARRRERLRPSSPTDGP